MFRQRFFKSILFILNILLCYTQTAYSQWEPLNGPDGGYIRNLKKNDQFLYAGTPSGLYRSTDGKSWSLLEFEPGMTRGCGAFGINDNVLIADSKEFFLSINQGNTWQLINKPPVNFILDIVLTHYAIYVHSYQGLWYSTDLGNSWQLSSFPMNESSVFSICVFEDQVVVGSTGKIFFSSPTADEWTYISVNYPDAQLHNLFISDSIWIAMDPYRSLLLRSDDGGQHWTPQTEPRWNSAYIQICMLKNDYFISLDSQIVKSTNKGISWIDCESSFYKTAIQMITIDSSLLFGTFENGVMRSDNFGTSCYPSTTGIHGSSVGHMAVRDQEIIATSDDQGIFDFQYGNQLWNQQYNDINFDRYFNDLITINESIYTVTDSRFVYSYDDASQLWVLISDSTFSAAGKMYKYEDTLLVSADGLRAWHPDMNKWSNFTISISNDTIKPSSFSYYADYIFCGTDNQLFRKPDSDGDWTRVLLTDTISGLVYHQLKEIYTIADKVFIMMVANFDSQEYRILMSEDQGASWIYVDEGFPELNFPWWSGLGRMQEIKSHLLITGYRYSLGVVVSELYPVKWYSFNEGLPSLAVSDITYDPEYIYAAVSNHGVWRRRISDLSTTHTLPEINSELLQCYPNPASQYFVVTSPPDETGPLTVCLYDVSGRRLELRKINPFNPSIDVGLLSNGIYFITLQGNHKAYTQKIVVQH